MSQQIHSIEEIFDSVEYAPLKGATAEMQVSSVEFSSNDVSEGALFFCVPGTRVDGHDYAEAAQAAGASALVVDHELEVDCPQLLVDDVRKALALCSANFYGNPSRSLRLVGITGTNGKTTTSFLVEHIAQTAYQKTGLMGTVECHIGSEVRSSLHTTPESRDLQELLADMVAAEVGVAALEVSSHAIDLGRIAGTHFAVAAFTNLTQDHLDYHKTMENYFQAKAKLFTQEDVERSVVCTDGSYGRRLAEMIEACDREVFTVGSAPDAYIRLVSADYSPHSTCLKIAVRGAEYVFTLPLVGRFNVENALVAFGIGLALNFHPKTILKALESAPQVPGRMERVVASDGIPGDFGVLVDYSHTPDSIEKALAAVRAITHGRVICVFGCGGDRDHGKRPKMGKAALAADIAVVTSDNPRTEDPEAIIEQILPGMAGAEERTFVYPDRREAIRFALQQAGPGDAVLIAGKGHEDYQIVGTVKHPFDDRLVAREELDAL